MKNKTAVDWFFDKIKNHFEHDTDLYKKILFTYSTAKEREEIQIQLAFIEGALKQLEQKKGELSRIPIGSINYYKENYKK